MIFWNIRINRFDIGRFFVFGLLLFSFLIFPQSAFAQNSCRLNIKESTAADYTTSTIVVQRNALLTVRVQNAIYGGQTVNAPDDNAYYLRFPNGNTLHIPAASFRNGTFTMNSISVEANFRENEIGNVQLFRDRGFGISHELMCDTLNRVDVRGEACTINANVTRRESGTFNLGVSVNTSQLVPGVGYNLILDTGVINTFNYPFSPVAGTNGFNAATELDSGHSDRTFALYVKRASCAELTGEACAITGCNIDVYFPPDAEITDETPEPEEVLPENAEAPQGPPLEAYNFCKQVPAGDQQDACLACVGEDVEGKLFTAVGCIDISKTGLARDLIRLGLGVGGGISLLSILAGGFMFSTSQGDASKLKEAKNMITASVAGLFFMIFSTIILNFIGVEILRIPGLGG